MPRMRAKILWYAFGIFIILGITWSYWFTKAPKSQLNTEKDGEIRTTAQPLLTLSDSETQGYQSPSQQDTTVNCQLKTDAAGHLVINNQTRDCFEYFITQYGEVDLQHIKSNFHQFIQVHYLEPVRSQIFDLWSRYLKYREQLAKIQAIPAKTQDQNYYRSVFESTQQLRQHFFSSTEITALFSAEDIYQNYILDRLQILENASLNEVEKAERLNTRFEQLPEEWQQNLQELSKLDNLHTLTDQIKARHGSAAELHQMRVALVGIEATQRLESLDTQRTAWQQRVTGYLNERDQILNSSMSDSAKNQAIQQLRQQQFSSTHEQLRLQTFETVHDQGGKLPFSN